VIVDGEHRATSAADPLGGRPHIPFVDRGRSNEPAARSQPCVGRFPLLED
jgi:hypothetical protein